MSIFYGIQKRFIHITKVSLKSDSKRPTTWNLPDLDKLPGGFKGKVYNKRSWNEYLLENAKKLENEKANGNNNGYNITPPPKGWRKNKNLPDWLRTKYALKEKSMKTDLSKVKRLSPSTARAIRALHDEFSDELPNEKLAEFFKVSPIAISKILKSRWSPTEKELDKLESRWERKLSRQVTEKMIESKFNEFIEEKERKLKLEIPQFFKQELHSYYLKHGIENIKNHFDELNQARIEREKVKDSKISNYVNTVITSNPNNNNTSD
ncbi:Required for respiratory growth protein 9 mitochondrial [Pichia californica]|uniref:Required for respiratory growth protein 9, mitochondrial n=1 Tax=Pichia californica TaxID=460514 RepID=A0A9P6WKY2_9ASCO|nr:Required for respiratory growth protein 9 mitochondrial [[Candida] californica]KAG0689064.1 Required for respiratory growth protein 9 mitochondrial [[Candida] californica]